MKLRKRILLSPLDWGLGHAGRCIPIIRYLEEKGAEVIIGADMRPLAFLKKEFPHLEFVKMPGYGIRYPENGNMAVRMIRSIPRILHHIYREHQQLKYLVAALKIDGVISDNRYGLWSNKIPAVFITHQLKIKAPVAENILHILNMHFIKKYTYCWIPDVEGTTNLSGDLSHGFRLPPNAIYIGPLSRFSLEKTTSADPGYDLMVVLSGPEPQRSRFEQIILKQLLSTELKAIVVRGVTEKDEHNKPSTHLEIVSHLNSVEMQKYLLSSKLILCRSGYSTIMDLAVLKKKAILVPTPGQTEQEYLGKSLDEKNIAPRVIQKNMDLKTGLNDVLKYSGFTGEVDHHAFKGPVDHFLSMV